MTDWTITALAPHHIRIMPRPKKNRDIVVRIPFRTVAAQTRTTSGTSIASLNLTAANLGTRASFESENYEFFRIVSLRVYSLLDMANPGTATAVVGSAAHHAVAFVNSPVGSQVPPATYTDMAQFPRFSLSPPWGEARIRAGRGELLVEPLKWFNTEPTGSVPATMLSAGSIWYLLGTNFSATIGTCDQIVVIEGECEFTSPIAPTNSTLVHIPRGVADDPVVRRAADRLREVVSDMSATSTCPSVPATSR